MNLKALGEDRLLAQILTRLPRARDEIAGAGDDCAIVRPAAGGKLIVLKTDCVVESVHFRFGANPVDIGWKAMMRPLSDFAATSALPQFALVTLILSKEASSAWVMQVYRGLNRAAARFKIGIVGGELSSTPGPATISVSVAGSVEKGRWTSRRGGKAGDDLFVTGRLGGAIKRRHLRFIPRITESRWLTKHFSIHAMMDISDGLGIDLPRLARASKVGFTIDKESLPRARGATIDNAISDGEDYELLFAIARRDREQLCTGWRRTFPKVSLTRIGSLHRKSKVGNRKFPSGYVHFQ
jgi:thiamine-monophosphate kinase